MMNSRLGILDIGLPVYGGIQDGSDGAESGPVGEEAGVGGRQNYGSVLQDGGSRVGNAEAAPQDHGGSIEYTAHDGHEFDAAAAPSPQGYSAGIEDGGGRSFGGHEMGYGDANDALQEYGEGFGTFVHTYGGGFGAADSSPQEDYGGFDDAGGLSFDHYAGLHRMMKWKMLVVAFAVIEVKTMFLAVFFGAMMVVL